MQKTKPRVSDHRTTSLRMLTPSHRSPYKHYCNREKRSRCSTDVYFFNITFNKASLIPFKSIQYWQKRENGCNREHCFSSENPRSAEGALQPGMFPFRVRTIPCKQRLQEPCAEEEEGWGTQSLKPNRARPGLLPSDGGASAVGRRAGLLTPTMARAESPAQPPHLPGPSAPADQPLHLREAKSIPLISACFVGGKHENHTIRSRSITSRLALPVTG